MEIINESFKEYKDKFKEITVTMIPLFVIQLVLAIMIVGGIFLADRVETQGALISALGLSFVGLIATAAMVLVYMPATIRLFQRQAEGEHLSISQAVKIQLKGAEMWKVFKLMLTTLVVCVFYFTITVAPSFIIVAALTTFDSLANIATLIFGIVISIGATLYLAFINLPKILYIFNVFFSTKNYSAWQSAQESIRLGKKYRLQVWGGLLGITLFGIIGSLAQALVSFLIAPQEFMKQMKDLDYEPAAHSLVGSTLTNIVISVFFTAAIMYMYLSKKYQEVRKLDEAGLKDSGIASSEVVN